MVNKPIKLYVYEKHKTEVKLRSTGHQFKTLEEGLLALSKLNLNCQAVFIRQNKNDDNDSHIVYVDKMY